MSDAGGRKTIFITGAGSGIGRTTAKLFAERGWFVGLHDVSAHFAVRFMPKTIRQQIARQLGVTKP